MAIGIVLDRKEGAVLPTLRLYIPTAGVAAGGAGSALAGSAYAAGSKIVVLPGAGDPCRHADTSHSVAPPGTRRNTCAAGGMASSLPATTSELPPTAVSGPTLDVIDAGSLASSAGGMITPPPANSSGVPVAAGSG